MAKRPAYAKNYKNHKVMIFDETNTVTTYPVYSFDSDTVETPDDILRLSDATKVYDNNTGGFTFLFNVPEVAKVEAESLKSLRRNKAIKNMMSYDVEKSADMSKVFFAIVLVVAIIF